ncbi:MAG: hypothetical protein A2Z88_05990 [Omnitrophica WOR_2 bacterium GWA2_47_8]|nr:MAG: hypothetical protein A2Z88_05990 [Omnitrophica WOR_2 bacterium GWA2_47_8]
MLIRKKYQGKGFLHQRDAQTILEYMSLIGIIAAVFLAMSAYIGRGLQGMVKLVADQVGNQKDADQRPKQVPGQRDDRGFLINSYTAERDFKSKLSETIPGGNFIYRYGDRVESDSHAITNLGFREKPP